jgi:hypothetical protein
VTIPQRAAQRRGATGPRFPRRHRAHEPSRGEKLTALVRNLLPGGEAGHKRQGGRRPKRALLGAAGAGVAGLAVAARRRKRRRPADTQPQPEPRTVPETTAEAKAAEAAPAEAPRSEGSD